MTEVQKKARDEAARLFTNNFSDSIGFLAVHIPVHEAFEAGHDFAHERAKLLESALNVTSMCWNCDGCREAARAALAEWRGSNVAE